MSSRGPTLEQVLVEADHLSPGDRLRLIRYVAETLLPGEQEHTAQRLMYGEFRGERVSTEEDFALAEWRPSGQTLNCA